MTAIGQGASSDGSGKGSDEAPVGMDRGISTGNADEEVVEAVALPLRPVAWQATPASGRRKEVHSGIGFMIRG